MHKILSENEIRKHKSNIANNFNKNACTYDTRAKVQEVFAKKLAQIITENISIIPSGDIFELGCGTGLLSQELFKIFPNRTIYLTDISSNMLQLCKTRIDNKLTVHNTTNSVCWKIKDAELIDERNAYACVAANFLIQWFIDFETSIQRIIESLKPGAFFFFSLPIEGSFSSWQSICKLNNIPYTANPLPSYESLSKIALKLNLDFKADTEYFVQHFNSGLDLLHSIKKIGAASTLHNNHLNLKQTKMLIENLNSSSQIVLEYKILSGYFRKGN